MSGLQAAQQGGIEECHGCPQVFKGPLWEKQIRFDLQSLKEQNDMDMSLFLALTFSPELQTSVSACWTSHGMCPSGNSASNVQVHPLSFP